MTIEHADVAIVHKPWGSLDLHPWSSLDAHGDPIGELWFDRPDQRSPPSALLLKLLFTTEALSIQVHPDDEFARSIGLPQGKSEAWYVLAGAPDAAVALGLKSLASEPQLRAAVADGSIADMVRWRPVREGDAVSIPAGTIHALGAGLVVAEIQQRSDVTFRMFDHGRGRSLQVENALAVACGRPAAHPSPPLRLTAARTLLAADPHFVLEHVDLPPYSDWELHAETETWMLVLEGQSQLGGMAAFRGEAFFVLADRARIEVGANGLKGLIASAAAKPRFGMLRRLDRPDDVLLSSAPAGALS